MGSCCKRELTGDGNLPKAQGIWKVMEGKGWKKKRPGGYALAFFVFWDGVFATGLSKSVSFFS